MNYDSCPFYDLDCERFDCSECSFTNDIEEVDPESDS